MKLEVHTSKKEYQGRQFDSSIAFVKATQERSNFNNTGPKQFRPIARRPDKTVA